MAQVNPKAYLNRSCYEMALARVRALYDRFDKVVVAFSGGKDSTACLQVCLTVARERGRLPLDVFTFDEEAIPPETVEYMARVASWPDVRFRWYCVPVKHRNACSRSSPDWYCWNPADRAKWVRELPPGALTELPGFKFGMAVPECAPLVWGPEHGTVANVMGIRASESLTRYQSVATKQGFNAFLSATEWKWLTKAYPIYDWTLDDVWLAPNLMGWDYNRAYDLMEKAGISRPEARCSPPFGEQPIRRLHTYKTCWPDLWARMTARVPGAATAARYANTELYGVAVQADDKPADLTWEQHTLATLQKLDPTAARVVARAIQSLVRQHINCFVRSGLEAGPLPDAVPDAVSGFCWKTIYTLAATGGDKFNRQSQKANATATKTRKLEGKCVSGTVYQDQVRRGIAPTVKRRRADSGGGTGSV